MRRLLAATLCLILLGAACGDGDDDASSAESAPDTTSEAAPAPTESTEDTESTEGTGSGAGGSRDLFVSLLTDAGLDVADAECVADELAADGYSDLDSLAGLQDDPAAALGAVAACDISLERIAAIGQELLGGTLPEGLSD